MRKYLRVIVVTVMVAPALWGCSRGNGRSSSVSLDVASLMATGSGTQRVATAGFTAQHIVINVRDSSGNLALPPVVWDSSSHTYPTVYSSAPPNFSLTIPNGSKNMLVQVVVAGSNAGSTGGLQVIRYGDGNVDMSGGQDQTVNITEATFGSGSGLSGNLVGKYNDFLTGVGRNGRAIMQILPPGNKPPVAIQQVDIIGGWFNLSIIDGIPFSYVFEDGTTMFNSIMLSGASLSINGVIQPASSHLVGISVPASYQYNSGSCTAQNAQVNYFGFFGAPGAAANSTVAYSNAVTAQSGLYTQSASGLTACTSDTASYLLNWNSGSTNPTDVELVNSSAGTSSASGTAFANLLDLTGAVAQMTNGNSTAGFQSAYQSSPNHSPLSFSLASTSLSVSWAYLDADLFAGLNPIAGTEIFYKRYSAADTSFYQLNSGNGVSCDLLTAAGFTSAGVAPAPSTSLIIAAHVERCPVTPAYCKRCAKWG